MSDQEKYSFIVVKYAGAETGRAALDAVQVMAKEGKVKLKDAVAINKTEKGKIKLYQTKDEPGWLCLTGGSRTSCSKNWAKT